jgi:hypothetical protein
LKIIFKKEENMEHLSNINVFENWLYSNSLVLSALSDDRTVSYEVLTKRSNTNKIQNRINELGLKSTN